MRVIEIEGGSGPAEALRPADRPDPVARAGEVMIRVHAAGINRPDLLQRNGVYPPPPGASDIMGLEVAGEVETVGEGVTRWAVGDRVCALLGGGGYADRVVVDARHLLPIPDGLDYVQAAVLPETVFTVFANVFEAGGLKAGQTLLIHGATSGIGVTAIQMAKAAGATVIATSRGADKTAAARALGADVSLDAKTDDLAAAIAEAGGADVVLDMVGRDYAELNLKALKAGGRWVVIASLSGSKVEIDLMRVMLKRLVLTGSTLRSREADYKAGLLAEMEEKVWPLFTQGKLSPRLERTFAIGDVEAAFETLASNTVSGKVALVIDSALS